MRKRVGAVGVLLLALVLIAATCGDDHEATTATSTEPVQESSPVTDVAATVDPAPSEEPTVHFTGDDCTSSLTQQVPSGRLAIRVVNDSNEFMTLLVGHYPDGVDRADLVEVAAGIREPVPGLIESAIGQVRGGGESIVTFTFDPGRYWATCVAAEVAMSFATDDVPPTFVLDDILVVADSNAAATQALVWQRSGQEAADGTDLVGDDEALYLVQSPPLRSTDGLKWEPVILEGAPTADDLTGTSWTDTDAAARRIIHLTVTGGDATVYVFDLAAGQVHRTELPRVGAGGDVRGFVAIDTDGVAIAALYDNVNGASLPTVAYVTKEGSVWEPIAAGQLPERTILFPAAIGRGFVVTTGSSATAYWHSPDGVTWSQRDTDQPIPGALVTWGDAAVAFQESAFGPQALSATPTYVLNAERATRLVLDFEEPLVGAGSYGPIVAAGAPGVLGLSSVGSHFGEAWFSEFTPDGTAWLRDAVPFSGSGLAMAAAAGPDRFVVRTGNELWVATTTTAAAVTTWDAECTSTIPEQVEGSLTLDIHNFTSGPTAMVLGTYQPGFSRDDMLAYGRDISTRPSFIEALEIIEVLSGSRTFTFDPGPGTYFVVCMDTMSTMVLLDDLTVVG